MYQLISCCNGKHEHYLYRVTSCDEHYSLVAISIFGAHFVIRKLFVVLRFLNLLNLIRQESSSLFQFVEPLPGAVASHVRLEGDDARLELLEPVMLLVRPPGGLYVQRGLVPRAQNLRQPLRGDHPPEGLYLHHGVLQPEELSPLQAGAEPLLYGGDARDDLLMELDVQLDLLGLPEEDLGGAQLIVVPVEVESQQEVPDVRLRAQKTLGQ